MILGNIIGKTTTMNFKFLVKGNAKKFQYVQAPFKDNYVLAQIVEIEKELDKTVAFCNLLGYRENDKLKHLRYPLEPNTEVLVASEDFIKQTLDLKEDKNSAFIGKLDGYGNIKIYLDLNKLLTTHISILAKSGSGKSYSSSVIVEEIIEKEIPLLIIDPHGEYSSLKYESKDKESLNKFGLKPKSYKNKIQEYSPNTEDNPECIPLKLNKNNISASELMHLLPARLSNSQQAMLYSVLQNINKIDFNQLILELELEENNLKYTLINILKYLEKLNLFSDAPTSLQELIQPGKCSIINLKGVSLELQQVVVYKLMKDLFEARKKANVPPFFVVIEESHNFLPERTFGEAKSSEILRRCAAEGRKFGLGLCLHPKTKIQCNPNIDYIKNLQLEENIITYNLNDNLLESEKIINKIKINPRLNKLKIFRLDTETGRSIIGSEEHPFLTKQGWKNLNELNSNDFVAVYPFNNTIKIKRCKKKIINKKNIKKVLKEHVEDSKKVWNDYNHGEILNKLKNFMSLRYSDKKSLILARIVGHIFSDGCLKSNKKAVTFYLDSISAAEEVKKDLKILGISFGKTEKVTGNWGTEYRVESNVKPFWILMVSLGCPIGKKSKVPFLIPNWIKNGSKEVKREFLSALFGGDGSPSDVVDTRRRRISYFCFSKRPNLEKNGILYAKELKRLFNKFNVKVNSIKIKRHEKLVSFELRFGSERKNTLNLFEEIGSKYSYYKNKKMNLVLEYMKYQETKLKERMKNIKKIRELHKKKNSINNISKELNEDWHLINRVVKEGYKIKRNKLKDILHFKEWAKERDFKGSLILEKITKKEEIDYTGNLFDIETEKNHNFFANSFLTHNCAISQRPSRIDKTVLSQITTQIILKVTNPYDIKAIANSVENITSETEKEIKNIPIGTSIVTGVVDLPLFVNIRPRKTKHGGEAVDMLQISKQADISEVEDFKDKELLLIVKQKISVEDMRVMGEDVKVNLVPCLYINCGDFNLLFDLNKGELIEDIEKCIGKKVFFKLELSPQQKRVFDIALSLKEFKAADLFAKSGVQFSEVYDIINILVGKNYFVKINDKFKINPDLNLDFNNFAIYSKPDYFRLDYEKKLDKKFNSEEIKKFLGNFIEIKNSKECWLEVYNTSDNFIEN